MTRPIGANTFHWRLQKDSSVLPLPSHLIGQIKANFRRIIGVFGRLLKLVGRIILLMTFIIGGCTIYDEAIGDGALPTFNRLQAVSPAFARQATRNTTQTLPSNCSKSQAWQAMTASRELLTALSPEIAAWLYTLHAQNRVILHEPAENLPTMFHAAEDTQVIAAYRHIDGKLYLAQMFWQLSDGQKVAVLAHEYRHYRQNLPKRISRQLAQIAGGGQLRYRSLIEDEAFAYERQAQTALGLGGTDAIPVN